MYNLSVRVEVPIKGSMLASMETLIPWMFGELSRKKCTLEQITGLLFQKWELSAWKKTRQPLVLNSDWDIIVEPYNKNKKDFTDADKVALWLTSLPASETKALASFKAILALDKGEQSRFNGIDMVILESQERTLIEYEAGVSLWCTDQERFASKFILGSGGEK